MVTCGACGSAAPEAARFCPTCAAPLDEVPEESERKVATLIFADLVGSTALAGSQDPERTRALLERFYDAMTEEISTAGGTVEKFAGDAVMAAFGAPAALEDHAERALHAAIAMQKRLHDLAGGILTLRIGVNTGEVVAGRRPSRARSSSVSARLPSCEGHSSSLSSDRSRPRGNRGASSAVGSCGRCPSCGREAFSASTEPSSDATRSWRSSNAPTRRCWSAASPAW